MKKFACSVLRGIASLLIVAVVVSTVSFFIQSCAVNVERATTDKEIVRSNFISLAKSTSYQLKSIEERNSTIEMASDKAKKSKKELEKEAKKTLLPLLKSGRELLSAYGFADKEFKESGISINDPQLLYVIFAVLKVEELHQADRSFSNIFLNSCAEPAYASKLWNCIVVAVGMEIGIETFRRIELRTYAGRKMLIKMFTKIGARYLGWIGVAVSTYHFIDCMWVE